MTQAPEPKRGFSIEEISAACGIPHYSKFGISYGVTKLEIPLADGRLLCFRDGDADDDLEVVTRTPQPLIPYSLLMKPTPWRQFLGYIAGVLKRTGSVVLGPPVVILGALFYITYGSLLCVFALPYWLLTGKPLLRSKWNVIDL